MSCEDETADLLRRAGHKMTPQRLLIVRALRHAEGHVSAAQIAEQVREDYPFVDVSTVYRTLDVLKRMRLATSTDMGAGDVRVRVGAGRAAPPPGLFELRPRGGDRARVPGGTGDLFAARTSGSLQTCTTSRYSACAASASWPRAPMPTRRDLIACARTGSRPGTRALAAGRPGGVRVRRDDREVDAARGGAAGDDGGGGRGSAGVQPAGRADHAARGRDGAERRLRCRRNGAW